MTRDVTIGFLFSLIFHGCVLWYIARIQNDLVPPQQPPPILNLHLSRPAPSVRPASRQGDKAELRNPSKTERQTAPGQAAPRLESPKKRQTVSVKSQPQREKTPGQIVKVSPVIEQTPRGAPIGPRRVIAKAPETPIAPQGLIDQRIHLEETVGRMLQPSEEKARPVLQQAPHETPITPPRAIGKTQETPIATHGVINQPRLLEETAGKMPQLSEEKGRPVLEQIPYGRPISPPRPIRTAMETPIAIHGLIDQPILREETADKLPELSEEKGRAILARTSQKKPISPPRAIRTTLEAPIAIHGPIKQSAALEETLGEMRPLSKKDKSIGTGLQAHAPGRGPTEVVEAKPNYAVNPKPLYPRRAIRRGYEGTVTLLVEVLSDGSVREIEILESSSYPILDRSALKTVRTWRFIPGKRGEEPVTMKVKVPVVFKLKKAKDG